MQPMQSTPRSRFLANTWLPGIWLAAAFAALPGGTDLHGQQVIDLPAEDRLLSADFEQVYRIGSADAVAPWELFSDIRGAGFDAAGNLYLLDRASGGGGRVVVVDSDGGHVRDVGRTGDGPGEFQSVTRLVVWPDGAVLVSDMMRGYHLFGPGGEFEHTARESAPSSFIMASRAGLRPERTGSWSVVAREERAVQRLDMSAEQFDAESLVQGWTPRPPTEFPSSGGFEDVLDMLAESEWGFEPAVLFDALPGGGIAFSDSSAYAIKLADPSGTVSRVLHRAIQPMQVTEGMKEAERERQLERESERQPTRIGGGDPPPEVMEMFGRIQTARRESIDAMRFHPEAPVVASLRVAWDGTLWVERRATPGEDGPGPIDLIRLDGSYIGTFPAGEQSMPDAFGPNGLVAFLDTDEFDVPVVTVRRLQVGR